MASSVQVLVFPLINLSFRLLLLGFVVFLAVTFIPRTPHQLNTRILISVAVVLAFAFLDIVLKKIKNLLCSDGFID